MFYRSLWNKFQLFIIFSFGQGIWSLKNPSNDTRSMTPIVFYRIEKIPKSGMYCRQFYSQNLIYPTVCWFDKMWCHYQVVSKLKIILVNLWFRRYLFLVSLVDVCSVSISNERKLTIINGLGWHANNILFTYMVVYCVSGL